jgi:hypothetical protein
MPGLFDDNKPGEEEELAGGSVLGLRLLPSKQKRKTQPLSNRAVRQKHGRLKRKHVFDHSRENRSCGGYCGRR